MQELLEYNSICPNGSKKCFSGYQVFTVDRHSEEHESSTVEKTMPPKKLTKRKKAHSLKSTRRDKVADLERRKDHVIRIPNEDFMAWHVHEDIQLYMLDTEEPEDPNISEDASFDKSSFMQDVNGKTTTALQNRENRVFNKRGRASPRFPAKERTPPRSKVTTLEETNSGLIQLTSQSADPEVENDVLSDYTEKILYLIVGVLLGVTLRGYFSSRILSIYVNAMAWLKNPRRYKQLNSKKQPRIAVDSNLNLSMLPPDLEDLLCMKLDVRRKGERSSGWRKVGAEFKVSQDHLRYLNIEYRRDNGSPTSKLLQVLGTRGKTISDLVDVLKSPRVNRLDIANLITLT